MKRFTYLLLVVFLASPVICPSAELHIWVDERGVSHITDRPPEKSAKIIGKEAYKRDSPEEIRRYQAGEKAKEQRRDAELRQRQQANRAQEEANRQANQNSSSPSESAIKRNEQTGKTDRLTKEFWEEVDRSRRNRSPVSKSLRDEYIKAVAEDPRTITTTTTTTRSR
jgi:molecular chaperone DnaK (HSP70)